MYWYPLFHKMSQTSNHLLLFNKKFLRLLSVLILSVLKHLLVMATILDGMWGMKKRYQDSYLRAQKPAHTYHLFVLFFVITGLNPSQLKE